MMVAVAKSVTTVTGTGTRLLFKRNVHIPGGKSLSGTILVNNKYRQLLDNSDSKK